MSGKRTVAMKRVCVAAMALAIIPMSFASAAPSGADVIASHIKAIGGAKAVAAVKSRVSKGVFALVDMGMTASLENYNQPPNNLTKVSLEGMGEVNSGLSDGIAWEMHFMNGDSILEGDKKDDALKQASLNELAEWEKWYSKAECVGEETVGETATWKVVLTPKGDGEDTTLYFAQDSGLLIQREGAGPDGMPTTSTISDYRDVGGIQVAHKIFSEGMMNVEITFESIEHNVDIPADTFALPEAIVALNAPPEEVKEEGSDSKDESSDSKDESSDSKDEGSDSK